MTKSVVWAVVAVLLAASLASAASGSERRGWPRPHRERIQSAAAVLRHDCLARCKSNYEINVSFCTSMPRVDRKECRAEESWDRHDCVARCRR